MAASRSQYRRRHIFHGSQQAMVLQHVDVCTNRLDLRVQKERRRDGETQVRAH